MPLHAERWIADDGVPVCGWFSFEEVQDVLRREVNSEHTSEEAASSAGGTKRHNKSLIRDDGNALQFGWLSPHIMVSGCRRRGIARR